VRQQTNDVSHIFACARGSEIHLLSNQVGGSASSCVTAVPPAFCDGGHTAWGIEIEAVSVDGPENMKPSLKNSVSWSPAAPMRDWSAEHRQ
jgi:hypothetical protein